MPWLMFGEGGAVKPYIAPYYLLVINGII